MWLETYLIHGWLLRNDTAEGDRVSRVSKEAVKPEESLVERPRNTELVVDPHVAQWFVRTTTRAAATYAILVGLTILFGGAQRFSGLSYQVALGTPGAPASWGVTILLAGLLSLAGSLFARPRLIGLGALLGCIWALLFAFAFTRAALCYDQANTTAPWAYILLCVTFGLIAGVHLAMKPITTRRKG